MTSESTKEPVDSKINQQPNSTTGSDSFQGPKNAPSSESQSTIPPENSKSSSDPSKDTPNLLSKGPQIGKEWFSAENGNNPKQTSSNSSALNSLPENQPPISLNQNSSIENEDHAPIETPLDLNSQSAKPAKQEQNINSTLLTPDSSKSETQAPLSIPPSSHSANDSLSPSTLSPSNL